MEFFNNLTWQTWGWLAAVCFGVCAIPQAYKCFKTKNGNGISWAFLILWVLGEIFATMYILPRFDIPLLTNYTLNMLFIAIIIYYKVKGEKYEQKVRVRTSESRILRRKK